MPYQPYMIEVVTEAVRRTGQSAHPQTGELVSPLVRQIAAQLEVPATLLQVEVERWADAYHEES